MSQTSKSASGPQVPQLSRRALIGGTSAAAVATRTATAAPASAPIPQDATRRFAQWLSLNARIERLQARWGRLESWLAREHGWLQLSASEQQALPWAQELRDIDGCLDLLFEKRQAALDGLTTPGSPDSASIIGRLAVAERLIWAEDHPEAHALIARALKDLRALHQGGLISTPS